MTNNYATITLGPTGSLGEAVETTPEAVEQRRERLARVIDPPAFDAAETVELRDGRQARAYATADRIIASDAAAGDDPEALRKQIEQLKHEVAITCGVICDTAEELGVEADNESILLAIDHLTTQRDEARAEAERLTKALEHHRKLTEGHRAFITASVAREGALREVLNDINQHPYYTVPVPESHVSSLAKRYNKILDTARSALSNPSPAAAAMLRVVGAGRKWLRSIDAHGGDGDAEYDLIVALRALDGKNDHD